MDRPDPTRAHPDPSIETILSILGRTAQALARCGASEHARERFRQGIAVGEALGGFSGGLTSEKEKAS